MTIELSGEVENQLKEAAQAQGVSVVQFLEKLIEETNLRRRKISEFKAVMADRIASLNADGGVDGEEVMARLIADLPSSR
jgi:hypothetical protein